MIIISVLSVENKKKGEARKNGNMAAKVISEVYCERSEAIQNFRNTWIAS